MPKRYYKKIISIPLAVVALLYILYIPQAMAWGDLTHYSISRDAGINTAEGLSASAVPDVLIDFNYGNNFLDTFVHLELPGVLYGPLDYYMYTNSGNQNKWASGWTAHIIADRLSHGTYLEKSQYPDPDNYLSAVGTDTLQEHLKAELGGDILSYWLNQGTMPEYIVIYPDQVRVALKNYDAYCNTNYSGEYDQERYLSGLEWLHAAIYAEQMVVDYNQDRKLQFTDQALLEWAYQEYYEPYEKYYLQAVNNVKIEVTTGPVSSPSCSLLTGSQINGSEHTEIKINVGKQLIDGGLIKSHKRLDEENGTIIMNFEQAVSNQELAGAYKQYLEKAYEEQTGKKLNIQDEIESKGIYIMFKDIKKDYPELHQKLVEKGVVEGDVPLIEYIRSIFKVFMKSS